MSWSDGFSRWVDAQFDGNKMRCAFFLKVSTSRVHDWCNGTKPRQHTQERIKRASKGAVIPEAAESTPRLAKTGATPRRKASAS